MCAHDLNTNMTTKILFITSNRLGDAVLSTGLYDFMAQTYPDAKISVACGPLATSIFEGFPNLDRIYPLKKEKRAGHWRKLWLQIVSQRWDIVVDLRNSAVSRLILAKQRHVFGPHIDKSRHKVEQAALTMKLDDVPSPKLYHSKEQLEKADILIPNGTPVLGVGPAANWIGKTWPKERFIDLVGRITANNGILPNARVAVFAAPGEEEMARPVLESIEGDRQIDVIAKASPGEGAAALSKCDLYVGNDSGLMHAAAACDVPTFGLFGPSYPHLYRPWGKAASYISTPKTFDELIDYEGYSPETAPCLMTDLETDNVYNALNEFWQNVPKQDLKRAL